MPVAITNVTNQQDLEVEVNGPDPANRMFIVSGIGQVSLAAYANAGEQENQQQTFTVHVGPTLTSGQFASALATAAPASFQYYMGDPPQSYGAWRVVNVDADYDDEADRVQLSIEAEVDVFGAQAIIQSIAFEATILAAM